jgi:hypothetical protein
MARRRKRKLKAGVLIWALVLVNLVAGLLFSPITSAAHIRVVGARGSDKKRIDRELDWLRDKPCLAVNAASVEEQVMRRPDVRAASLSRNIFRRAQLEISYYEPVALVQGTKNVVLTEGGFLAAVPDPDPELPSLMLAQEAGQPMLGLSSTWEPASVAAICQRASQQGLVKNLSITVTKSGWVCLNSGDSGRVVLGAPDDLDEKFEKIRAVLAVQPELLSQGKELVLIAPAKPVTRPLQGNPQ